MRIEKKIKKIFDKSIEVKKKTNLIPQIQKAVELIYDCYQSGNKVFVCGNGGSAEQAQHMVAELVGRFKLKRTGLPAIALTTNTPLLTAWANDYNFETVFARELEALGKKGDMLIAISTSGNSENVIQAVKTAKKLKIKSIGLLGKGGKLKNLVSLPITVPSRETPRIQEVHLLIIHIICEIIEDLIFKKSRKS